MMNLRHHYSRVRMRGMALVTVMFILTIMTVTVSWLSEELLLSLRRTENIRDNEQSWQMLMGSEAWAVSVLARDRRESVSDHSAESWNNLGQGVAIEHGTLSTAIEDMQGRFNLNNLLPESTALTAQESNQQVQRVWTQAFRRLLASLGLNPDLSDAVLDWLDVDQDVRGSSGAEDSDYLSMDPPYRAANRQFSDISELLQVKGFDPDILQTLAPYIAALPVTNTRININTAPAGVLRILGKDLLSVEESEALVADRPETGYTVEEFLQHDMMSGEQDIATPLIGISSSYFLIRSSTIFGRARMRITSLVERKDEKTEVINRSPVL